MVYLYDEFFRANPAVRATALNKFITLEKNLHEMSLDELNEEVAKWSDLKPRSIQEQRANLIRYLKWLKEQGVNTNLDIMRQVKFPLKKEDYFIYSTFDIHKLWDELFNELEKQATIKGTFFSRKSYLVCYASGILSFYGLTPEQILSLNLSDVNANGVNGYDIKFTERDLDILLEYKNLTVLENKKTLSGYKYIRTTLKYEARNDEPSKRIIDHKLSETKSHNQNNQVIQDITTKLLCSFLFECGIYNRIFNYEIGHDIIEVKNQARTPDWFIDFIKVFANDNTSIISYKKKYVNYRTERKAYIKIMSQIKKISDN